MRMSRFDTPSKRTWIVLGKRFVAQTKSEAMAQVKRMFGRLPVGAIIVERKRGG